MPKYDFFCEDCRKPFVIQICYDDYGKKPVHCPNCQGIRVKRQIGRIRVTRTEEGRLEEFSDASSMDGIENNPEAMGKMLKKMKNQMGEEIAPEFDEMVDRLESGQSPAQIGKDLPDLANPAIDSSEMPGAGDLDF